MQIQERAEQGDEAAVEQLRMFSGLVATNQGGRLGCLTEFLRIMSFGTLQLVAGENFLKGTGCRGDARYNITWAAVLAFVLVLKRIRCISWQQFKNMGLLWSRAMCEAHLGYQQLVI
jgi:hypothetical protein